MTAVLLGADCIGNADSLRTLDCVVEALLGPGIFADRRQTR